MSEDYLKVAKGFDEHIKQNKHVLFSGIYGIGKTTYLKDYFNDNENFIAFHLFPVNYAVSDNSDVFELIKADLLYYLLAFIDPETLKNANSIYRSQLAGYLAENYDKIFFRIAKKVSKAGKVISQVIEEIEALKEGFEKYKSKESEKTKEFQVTKFFNSIDNLKGSVYESDAITLLIEELIGIVKHDNRNKKLVLVIDDLDRIDPGHVFRILNIFSAHFDRSDENKFSFDNIILVADYNNLKGIYHHFYGLKSSFTGYIDKFITSTVYQLAYDQTPKDLSLKLLDDSIRQWDHLKEMASILIENLFLNNQINFRQILKLNINDKAISIKDEAHFFVYLLRCYDFDKLEFISRLNSTTKHTQSLVSALNTNDFYYANFIVKALFQTKPFIFVTKTSYENRVTKSSLKIGQKIFIVEHKGHVQLSTTNDETRVVTTSDLIKLLITFYE